MDTDILKYTGSEKLVCPYCFHEQTGTGEWLRDVGNVEDVEEGVYTDIECESCGQAFIYSVDVVISYTSEKSDEKEV
ncbi:MAG: hypothetical protein GY862_32355 [Gammaproteobacteria bacterium]|nr:hypothetical protein [Gammaproteobacteria bacterium]